MASVKDVIVDSRINKVLAMRTDSSHMLEALDAISEFYVVNTVEARRALRQDLELQNITLAKKFLTEFDQVRSRIENVEDLSLKLEGACEVLAARVSEADQNMKSFMEKASELETKRNFYIAQSKEIGAFLGRFQLTAEEVDTLYRAPMDEPAGANAFFEALQRLRGAYTDCKEMVEKHCYSTGFELLDVLGQHQDTAYQRLFEWVKKKCDTLAESGTTVEDIDTMLQIAIRYLRKLPIYFAQCQDLVINSRRAQLVQKFVMALTHGGPSGQVFRAIDLHAHDAVRYVGDMLAWMHQAVASEEEFLEAVFGNSQQPKPKSAPSSSSSSSSSSSKPTSSSAEEEEEESSASSNSSNSSSGGGGELQGMSVNDLLARCLQGLGRPLRVRIMQTLESRTALEVLYTLTDLLAFYEQTFNNVVKTENAVHSTVKGCLGECKRMFITSLNKQAEALTQSPPSYPLDLAASHTTRECARQIQEVLRVHSSALSPLPLDASDPCHVDSVLGCIIQPLLQSCRLGGQSLQQVDMAVFMLNNVSLIATGLRSSAAGKAASSTWLQLLETEAAAWMAVLVGEEAGRTLHRSDLDKLLELIEVIPEGIVASEQAGLGQDRVGTVMRAFYASLFSTVAPQFERLQDPEMREATRKRTAEAVAEAHAKVYTLVSNPAMGYDRSVLAHTADEVKVLLGCN